MDVRARRRDRPRRGPRHRVRRGPRGGTRRGRGEACAPELGGVHRPGTDRGRAVLDRRAAARARLARRAHRGRRRGRWPVEARRRGKGQGLVRLEVRRRRGPVDAAPVRPVVRARVRRERHPPEVARGRDRGGSPGHAGFRRAGPRARHRRVLGDCHRPRDRAGRHRDRACRRVRVHEGVDRALHEEERPVDERRDPARRRRLRGVERVEEHPLTQGGAAPAPVAVTRRTAPTRTTGCRGRRRSRCRRR